MEGVFIRQRYFFCDYYLENQHTGLPVRVRNRTKFFETKDDARRWAKRYKVTILGEIETMYSQETYEEFIGENCSCFLESHRYVEYYGVSEDVIEQIKEYFCLFSTVYDYDNMYLFSGKTYAVIYGCTVFLTNDITTAKSVYWGRYQHKITD